MEHGQLSVENVEKHFQKMDGAVRADQSLDQGRKSRCLYPKASWVHHCPRRDACVLRRRAVSALRQQLHEQMQFM